MSIKERVKDILKSKIVRDAEVITSFEEATRLQRRAVADYGTDIIFHDQYRQVIKRTAPIT